MKKRVREGVWVCVWERECEREREKLIKKVYNERLKVHARYFIARQL